jgi:hypothetical protein
MNIKDQLKDIPIDQVAESLGLWKQGANLQRDGVTYVLFL